MKRGTKDWDRFWSKVKKGPGCWEWQASCRYEYGTFMLEGSHQSAHRVSYAMGHNIPKRLCVLHTCDNKICVRPSHLFLGTNADNTADMIAKGRQAVGVQHGSAKLTEVQVKAIRRDSRTQRVIAKQYKVNQTSIGQIKLRRTWKHIPEETADE